ncbi:hypothetical protein GCM10029964_044040 [Kibdelosporangium lantanae]
MLVGVAVVDAGDRAAEDERDQCLVAGRVDGDQPARGVLDQDVPWVVDGFAERCGRDVDAGGADEVALGTEGEAPDVRVQPVRADHQVEAARRGAVERDVHTLLVLVERGDRVVEEELGLVPRRLVQDGGEVGARHLDLVAPGRGKSHGGHLTAGGVEQPHGGRAGGDVTEAGQHTHRLGHRQGRASHVDGVAAGAQALGPLHHGGLEPVAGQPVREGRAGHAGAGDEP